MCGRRDVPYIFLPQVVKGMQFHGGQKNGLEKKSLA